MEERKAVQQGIEEMQVMKDLNRSYYNKLFYVNVMTQLTKSHRRNRKSSVVMNATSTLGEVVEIVNNANIEQEQTLELMEPPAQVEVKRLLRLSIRISGCNINRAIWLHSPSSQF